MIGFAGIIAREQVGLGGQRSYRECGQIIKRRRPSCCRSSIRSSSSTGSTRLRPPSRRSHLPPRLTASRVIASHAAELEANGIAITLIDRSCNAALLADPRAFRRILEHLLSNAIPTGRRKAPKIKVRIMVDREGRLSLAVRDTGIGIPPDALARVSEAFFQVLASGAARSHDGVGLGLTLTKGVGRGAWRNARDRQRARDQRHRHRDVPQHPDDPRATAAGKAGGAEAA